MISLSQIKSQPIPPALLNAKKVFITGPFGCGKSTIAFALAQHHTGLIYEQNTVDIHRINGGVAVIDDVRRLIDSARMGCFDRSAKCKAYIIDEIHALPDKASQALLIPVEEDTKNLWIACTTRPDKVDPGLKSRFAYHLALTAPSIEQITAILMDRGVPLNEARKRADNCNGDLRRALDGDSSEGVDPKTWTNAKGLFKAAVQNPVKTQVALLEQHFGNPEKHAALAINLNPNSYELAAHQLVASARRAGVVK